MTVKHHIPIDPKTVEDLLLLLRTLDTYPSVMHRARDLARQLGEAAAIGGEYTHTLEMLGAELIEAVNYATGRQVETVLSPATVKAAKVALEDVAPALGANVIPLPRVPDRDTQTAIESAAQAVFDRAAAPLSGVIVVDGVPLCDAVELWAAPAVGNLMHFADGAAPGRVIVRQVCWLSSRTIEVQCERTWPAKADVPALREVGQ